MLFSKENMPPLPSTETVLSVAASLTASTILFRSVVSDIVPDAVNEYFSSIFQKVSTRLSNQLTVVIEEVDGLNPNKMFKAASVYLGSNLSPLARRIKVNQPEKEKGLAVSIDRNQELVDVFKRVKLKWVLVSSTVKSNSGGGAKGGGGSTSEVKYFELKFHQKHREMVLSCYLPYVLQKAREIGEEKKTLKMHAIDYNGTDYWGSIILDHPATIDSIAMEPEMKKELIEDLDRFIAKKEFYRSVGKAWKRGYLLYGPPGTGKSSLVAAMANYLKFDIYDLDLTEVQCNSDLRRLLIGSGNRSMLVIEDIDRSFNSLDEDKVSLAALLNTIDGLWSSCGDERIIVFTTNNKDQLDPALLRPGRMDVHLHMSYCSFTTFKILVSNYLKIQEHRLFGEILELFESSKVQVTPAEMAGELMKSEDPEVALAGVIMFLQNKAAVVV